MSNRSIKVPRIAQLLVRRFVLYLPTARLDSCLTLPIFLPPSDMSTSTNVTIFSPILASVVFNARVPFRKLCFCENHIA